MLVCRSLPFRIWSNRFVTYSAPLLFLAVIACDILAITAVVLLFSKYPSYASYCTIKHCNGKIDKTTCFNLFQVKNNTRPVFLVYSQQEGSPCCPYQKNTKAHSAPTASIFAPTTTAIWAASLPSTMVTASSISGAANEKNPASAPSGSRPTETTTIQPHPALTFPTAPFPKPRLDISHRKC